MNREIKFRSFYNNKRMLYSGSYINLCYFFELNPEQFTLMQYTGLKDKKGVEIYEGDIVKGFIHDKEIEGQRNDFIIFQNGKFEFKNTPSDLISFCYPLSIKQIEIIGNIHENPELLCTSQSS